MLLVAARLLNLQIYQHEELSDRARKQQQHAVETSARRGEVLDRLGRELARSIDTESFFADLSVDIPDLEGAAECLAETLNLDRNSLRDRLLEARNSNKKFVWLARRLNDDDAARVYALKIDWVDSG